MKKKHFITNINNSSSRKIKTIQQENLINLLEANDIKFSDPYETLLSLNIDNKFIQKKINANSGIILGTGGTSAERKTIFHDWEFYNYVCNMGERSVKYAFDEFEVPKIIGNCMSVGPLWGGFVSAHDVIKNLRLQEIPITSNVSSEDLFDYIVKFNVDTLIGIPSFFIDRFFDAKNTKAMRILKNILYIGETFEEDQRVNFQGINIKSLAYSTSEIGAIGYQCVYSKDNVFHINEDAYYVEIIEGEIIATPLLKFMNSVFRFATGDLGEFITGKCDCGANTKRLKVIGRKSGFNICGTTISHDDLISMMSKFEIFLLKDFQVVVDKKNNKIIFNFDDQKYTKKFLEKIENNIKKNALIKHLFSKKEFGGLYLKCASKLSFYKSEITGKVKQVVVIG